MVGQDSLGYHLYDVDVGHRHGSGLSGSGGWMVRFGQALGCRELVPQEVLDEEGGVLFIQEIQGGLHGMTKVWVLSITLVGLVG